MKKTFLLILILLLLAACDKDSGNEASPIGAEIENPETAAPTPTLLPGLPTETPPPGATTGGRPAEDGPTSTPSPTLTPSPAPTITPEPAERFPLGQTYFFYENYEAAVSEFRLALAAGILDEAQSQEALLKLGQSFYHLGQYEAAAQSFNELLAQLSLEEAQVETAVSPGQPRPIDAYYWLGLSYQNMGDCSAAIGAYETYLAANPDMAAYVKPAIAACHLALDDITAAIAAFQVAATGDATPIVRYNIHHQLADYYLENEDYESAMAEYEAILTFAVTSATRGQTHYLIGTVARTAGDDVRAVENFLTAVNDYPQARESYLSLVILVEAGVEVDMFQRGLVDYYADVYEPAVTAFTSYIEANPTHREDAHLYLAWTYESLGNIPAAVAEIDAYITANEPEVILDAETGQEVQSGGDLSAVANGFLERGKLLARAGLYAEAAASYTTYIERFPAGGDAPSALWWTAELNELLGDTPRAIALYQTFSDSYPDHQDADEALFLAGFLERAQGNEAGAIALWQETAETYPNQQYGGAALLWLLKSLPPEEAAPYLETARTQTGASYFSLRASHVAQEIPPFEPVDAFELVMDSTAEQTAAENWLREWLQLPPETDVATLSGTLANDPRLIRGEKLWRLNLRAQAKSELEAVRQANEGDVLLSYQMALYLSELGLYRSSIAAAETVMRQALLNPLTAPTFLAKLAYPIYYGELVAAAAEQYGYDPLLQFALIRQESLYESFALSTAVAQGLSQVIPDTGAYIAGQLDWPDYENEDLYRPFVGIAFGAYYLDQQLDTFDGFVPAALSAYNAGPGNAARWYGQESQDIDRYHELVNFSETKLYIERIYIGQAIYKHLYGT